MSLLTLDLFQIDGVLSALDTQLSTLSESDAFVRGLRLNQIEANLDQLRKELVSLNYHQHRNTSTYQTFVRLTTKVTEAQFAHRAAQEVITQDEALRVTGAVTAPAPVARTLSATGGESLAELRKRLLLNGTQSMVDDSNLHQESLQEELVEDISSLVSVLRSLALRFQEELMEDSELLQRTMASIDENSTLMKGVNGLLRLYNLNKGDKVSFWFLLKAAVYLLVLFVLMLLVIQMFKSG